MEVREKERESRVEFVNDEELLKKFAKLKYRCLKNYPFYGELAYRLQQKIVKGVPFPLATDGTTVYISADLPIMKEFETEDDLLFGYLHELKHVAFLHQKLASGLHLNPVIWNMATDIIINELTKKEVEPSEELENAMLTADKIKELKGKDVLKMGALEIYGVLLKKYKKTLRTIEYGPPGREGPAGHGGEGPDVEGPGDFPLPPSGGGGPISKGGKEGSAGGEGPSGKEGGSAGSGKESTKEKLKGIAKDCEEFNKKVDKRKDLSEAEKNAIKDAYKYAKIEEELEKLKEDERKKIIEKIRKNISDSYNGAKQRGIVSAGVENIVETVFKKVRDWKNVLKEELNEEKAKKGDWTWTKINKKLHGLYEAGYNNIAQLPTYKNIPGISKIVIGIDTSGSISDEDYKKFLNEVYSLFHSMEITDYEIALWETDVMKIIKNKTDTVALSELKERKGYGGTELKSFLEHYKNVPANTIAIILTDGYFEENLTPKDFEKFKKVIFVLPEDGTDEYIPKTSKIKVIRMVE